MGTKTVPPTARTTRHEIQALRAVAVLAVIGYHFWPTRVPGGYLGVDIFFVISGYLITDHILRRRSEESAFSFGAFYRRRALRILPAATTVLLATLVGVVFISSRIEWSNFSTQIAASAVFVENWVLGFLQVDYLGSLADPSPVQHYWSLSVEEQFYLVWPVLLILVVALGARLFPSPRARSVVLFTVMSFVTVASLGYAAYLLSTTPIAGFFNTFGRGWEFSLGGLLAVARITRPHLPVARAQLRVVMSIAGWVLIGVALWWVTGSGDSMSSDTQRASQTLTTTLVPILLATFGTLTVIAAGSPRDSTAWVRVFRNPVITFIAAVSFAAYLWHWPLLVFAEQLLEARPTTPVLIGLVALTLLLAFLTTRFVENPLRRLSAPRVPNRQVFLAALVVTAVTVGGASVPWIASEAMSAKARESTSAPTPSGLCVGAQALDPSAHCAAGPYTVWQPNPLTLTEGYARTDDCLARTSESEETHCEFGDPTSDFTVALVGDSHATMFFVPMSAIAQENGWRLVVITRGRCPWAAPTAEDTTECAAFKNDLAAELATPGKYDLIVTSSRAYASLTPEQIIAAWTPVLKTGTQIVTVRDNAHFAQGTRPCVLEHLDDPTVCVAPRTEALGFDPHVEAAHAVRGVGVIDLTQFYCDSQNCFMAVGGLVMYQDSGHLTEAYLTSLTPYVNRQLRELHPEFPYSTETS